MLGTDRRAVVAAVLVAAWLASPQPVRGQEAPAAQAVPESTISVTYPAGPDGEPLREGSRLNARGEFLTSLAAGSVAVWRPGGVARVTDPGDRAVARDLSDRRHVAGHHVGSGVYEARPFTWSGRTGLMPLPTGSLLGMAVGVNDRGQVWGLVYPPPGSAFPVGPFLPVAWDRGELVEPPAGMRLSMASAVTGDSINDRGQVVVHLEVGGETHAAIWQIGGGVVDLGTLGGPSSSAAAINEAGEVVGSSMTADGDRHAFLWRDGEMIDLGTLGGPSSEAVDLNDRGEVIGLSLTGDGAYSGFLWRDGEMTRLGSLGGTCCSPDGRPADINNRGQVVGHSHTPDGERHAVLWHEGESTDLGALAGDQPSQATDINDRGQVLGRAGSRVAVWHLRPGGRPGQPWSDEGGPTATPDSGP